MILGFDTSGPYCTAAVLQDSEVLAVKAEEMGRGQAERLIPLIEECLAMASVGWADFTRIGVGIGPGNFTGIRISVAAARGLALALNVPAVGVSGFEVAGFEAALGWRAILPAPRGQVYLGGDGISPAQIPNEEAGEALTLPDADTIAIRIAQIAARDAIDRAAPPSPLYIRAADAAPSRDTGPVMLP